MEIKREAKTFIVDYKCDECVIGIMKPGDTVLTSWPPQFPHKCTGCGKELNLPERYPKIEHVLI